MVEKTCTNGFHFKFCELARLLLDVLQRVALGFKRFVDSCWVGKAYVGERNATTWIKERSGFFGKAARQRGRKVE